MTTALSALNDTPAADRPTSTATESGGAPADNTHLRRLRWAVRATLTLGVAASVAANICTPAPTRSAR